MLIVSYLIARDQVEQYELCSECQIRRKKWCLFFSRRCSSFQPILVNVNGTMKYGVAVYMQTAQGFHIFQYHFGM